MTASSSSSPYGVYYQLALSPTSLTPTYTSYRPTHSSSLSLDSGLPSTASSSSSAGRHRINMACTYCRMRKIKCSGQSPCTNCVRTKRCCVFEEVPDEVNRRTKTRKAHFKALRAAGFPTKTKLARSIRTPESSPALAPTIPSVHGWAPSPLSISPTSAFCTPPPPQAQCHGFPSVLTPCPVWTPELEGFSCIDPNASSPYPQPPSPTSSLGSISPSPFSSPLTTPKTTHSAALTAPGVSHPSDTGNSPPFEFDRGLLWSPEADMDREAQASFSYSSFPTAPPPCDLRAYEAFPSASNHKRPAIVSHEPPLLPSPVIGNPGLGFVLPADLVPGLPVDERFVAATADGKIPQSIVVPTEDTWTTPFATISLTDAGPICTWSLV